MASGPLVAIFGGTFDPPHLGHVQAARDLMTLPHLAEVRVLVSGQPPLKSTHTPAEHRLAMARAAFAEIRAVVIDDREVRRARARPDQVTTTYETLLEMRREFPRLAFVMGTDQVEGFPRWHRFPELLTLCHWRVLARRPGGAERARRALQAWAGPYLERLSDHVWRVRDAACGAGGLPPARRPAVEPLTLEIVETEAPEISSTRLREALATHGALGSPAATSAARDTAHTAVTRNPTDPATLLSPAVWAYIRAHRLYGATLES